MRSARSITAPWPPSVNAYWAPMVIRGRPMLVLTPRARRYCKEVQAAIFGQFGTLALEPIVGRVRLEIELRPPDRRRRDVSNHVKGIEDALTKALVWNDDEQIDELVVRRGPLTSGGAALCLITEL